MAAELTDHDAAMPGGRPSAAEPDPEPDSALVGQVIGGRYRILREMARGGLGCVYEAQHVELERNVAIKVLTGEVARNAEAIRRFQREARTASQIGHPNIVDVHDLGRTADGSPFLAMERLEGEDLDDVLERDPRLPPERVIAILKPVASALDAVHERGIVHRDVKPANIFLAKRIDGSEQVKLLDFGLAAFHERGDRLTQVGSVVGTPHYMSPEAAEGELSGPAGDVYALAAVAYECLCGVLPFDAEQATGVLVKKVARPAPRMSDRTGQAFPEPVEDVLALALDRNPMARPASCLAFVEALEAALDGQDWGPVGDAPFELDIDDAPLSSADIIESGSYSAPPIPAGRSRAGLFAAIGVATTIAIGAAAWFALDPGGDPAAASDPIAAEPPADEETAPAANEDGAESGDPEAVATGVAPAEADPPERAGGAEGPEGESGAEVEAGGDPEAAPAQATAAQPRTRRRGQRGRPGRMDPSRSGRTDPNRSASPDRRTPEADPPPPEEPGRDSARAGDLARQAGGALLRGSVAQAASLYRQATNADPSHAAAWRGLGLAQERMGHSPEAVRAYRRYLRLAPSAGDAGSVRRRIAALEGG